MEKRQMFFIGCILRILNVKKVKETVGKPKAAGFPGAAGRNTELPAEDPRR